ncbi:hypothetical protein [Agriterribacter sp.]|uniref:hypothetical protein n=1 Tax=Agriterribacter sp. TaxID=2821509 RepID=UPI002C2797FB|nr:hypothetical protein [Agriterribacter sp.]HRP55342.1 hypothetical protein [Agriterribacter sp.]
MRTTHLHIADHLLEYILPYPGEKDIREIEHHLNISPLKLQLFLTEIGNEKPGWIYKSVGENNEPKSVGIIEEMKPEVLDFLSKGGFSKQVSQSNMPPADL